MEDKHDSAAAALNEKHLVVVHKSDRSITKGTLTWPVLSEHPAALPPLPAVVGIQDETTGATSLVELTKIKALLFVRDHTGNAGYDEVKFFVRSEVSNLWVKVRMIDGEVFEGRTENNVALLTDSGFWLWPTDIFTNNRLIYVPKSSIVEFHVMGMAPRPMSSEQAAASCC